MTCTITLPNGPAFAFDVDPYRREALLAAAQAAHPAQRVVLLAMRHHDSRTLAAQAGHSVYPLDPLASLAPLASTHFDPRARAARFLRQEGLPLASWLTVARVDRSARLLVMLVLLAMTYHDPPLFAAQSPV